MTRSAIFEGASAARDAVGCGASARPSDGVRSGHEGEKSGTTPAPRRKLARMSTEGEGEGARSVPAEEASVEGSPVEPSPSVAPVDSASAGDPRADDDPRDDDLDDLDFGHADHERGARACAICAGSLHTEYYDVDGREACSACARRLVYGEPGDSRAARAGRALGLGGAAAVIGALVWYGIRAATGYEIGLIAIAVGFGVGYGVKGGSRNMGGWFYQLLAMGLTYFAIVSTYVPDLTEDILHPTPVPGEADPFGPETTSETAPDAAGEAPIPVAVALVIACVIAPFAPFLMGLENIIGIALIAFALWEAWRLNKKPVKAIRGPLRLGLE